MVISDHNSSYVHECTNEPMLGQWNPTQILGKVHERCLKKVYLSYSTSNIPNSSVMEY